MKRRRGTASAMELEVGGQVKINCQSTTTHNMYMLNINKRLSYELHPLHSSKMLVNFGRRVASARAGVGRVPRRRDTVI